MKALFCANMLTTLCLVVATLVSTTNGHQVDGAVKCFKLEKDQNYVVEGERMYITGNEAMCDCFDNLNKFNTKDITKIIIGKNVRTIGAGCFTYFEHR